MKKKQEEVIVRTLPVGTIFWVVNGCWEGEIVEIDGQKYVSHERGEILLRDDDDYTLTIERRK